MVVNPKPSAAQEAYLGEAGRAYHEGKRAIPHAAVPWLIQTRARLFQSEIRSTDSVFEWGCGFGWNLAGLHCFRRCGYDVATQLEADVRALGIEFLGQLEALPSNSFQVILCHHALEHVSDPLAALLGIRRLLARPGKLLLAVPFERERRYRRFDPAEPNHHLFSWNVQTLGNLLHVAGYGLRELGLRSYGYDRRAALIAVRLGLGERGFRLIRRVLQILLPLREITAVATVE